MIQCGNLWNRACVPLFVLCVLLLVGGCASLRSGGELPPILAQDEVLRPYQRVGAIEVTRERWGHPADLTPADFDWGYHALRLEAAKLGADAVIFPEVKSELEQYLIFPTSEMKAKGVAIKFR